MSLNREFLQILKRYWYVGSSVGTQQWAQPITAGKSQVLNLWFHWCWIADACKK